MNSCKIIEEGIQDEIAGADYYKNLKKEIGEDFTTRTLLDSVITDEQKHLIILKELKAQREC